MTFVKSNQVNARNLLDDGKQIICSNRDLI